jgi:tetratricopeptide (TPR) repeat protein
VTPASRKPALLEAATLLLILVAGTFCAWPGMHSPLFSDDIYQLEKSKHFLRWTEIFGTDVFGLYRPVKNLVFMLAAPLEQTPSAWHWIGLGAYLAATIGVFRITAICLGSHRLACLAAGAWALSPTCVSTAIWLSCANISIGIVFAAVMFHGHEESATRRSPAWLVAAALCYGLALLCYESLIVIPALLFIRDLQQQRIAINKRALLRYGTYTVVALTFLAVRHHFSAKGIGGNNFHSGFAPDTTPLQLVLSAPWFLWRHFLMWVVPPGKIELLGSYQWLRSASPAALVFGWTFLIALLAAAAIAWRRLPAISYGLLFFLVASIPSGNFLPCFNGPINDAYVTIPSIGLVLVFAKCCALLAAAYQKQRREAASGSIAIAAVLGMFLFYRIPACAAYFRYWAGVWNNPTELVLLMAESRPFQYQAKGFTSVLLLNDGYLEPAENMANEVIRDAPWSQLARVTLARIAIYRKDLETAERHLRAILDSPRIDGPLQSSMRFELANILACKPERRDEAAEICRTLLKTTRGERRTGTVTLLARIYTNQGSIENARATLKRGLELYPNHEAMTKMLSAIDNGEALPITPVESQLPSSDRPEP